MYVAPRATDRPRTSLSVCGGILGLDLGVRMVLPDLRLVGVVERQAHAASVIVARMAQGALDPAPVWDDLETFDGRAYSGLVDLVTAGIPCQGNSVAGRRRGTDDARWLWDALWRVVRDTGARWLFVENVPGLLTAPGDPLGEILGTLAASGWAAEWDHVPAGSLGAPHLRDRFFLLATDAHRVRLRVQPERDQRQGGGKRAAERRHRKPVITSEGGTTPASAADAGSARPQGDGAPWTATDRDGVTGGLLGQITSAGRAYWDGWSPEPVICGMDDGVPVGVDSDRPVGYADELYALGNAVVPYVAAYAFAGLWERLHGTENSNADPSLDPRQPPLGDLAG